jgi:ferric uptake regulator, fur family
MRNTKQKDLVLSILKNNYEHLDAYEVYNEAKKTIDNISLGTVYRVLKTLEETGKIKKLKVNDMYRYDGFTNKHHHFICNNCNKIIDIDEKFNLKFNLKNLEVDDYEIIFTGLCEDCRKDKK